MYAGHLGIALAAKSRRMDVHVGVFVAASLALEPFKHWLALALVVPVASGAIAHLWRHDWGLTGLVGATAASHFAVDLLTSRLELSPGGPTTGLGWYRFPALDFILEAAVIITGWWLYRQSRADNHPSDSEVAWLLAGLLIAQATFSILVAPDVV